MAYTETKLDDLAARDLIAINIGFPTTRLRSSEPDAEPSTVNAIVAKSVRRYYIDLAALDEVEARADFLDDPKKREFLTRAGDIVVKLSTPYECAIIHHPEDENLLVSSSCLFIRIPEAGRDVIDPYYLACYLTTDKGAGKLRDIAQSTGGPTRRLGVINKRELFRLSIPLPPIAEQRRCADAFRLVLEGIDNANAEIRAFEELQKNLFLTIINKDGE